MQAAGAHAATEQGLKQSDVDGIGMLPDGLHGKEEDLCLIATPQEVAAVMLVDESTVRRACADGMMPDGSVFRVGNLWRIAPDVAYPGIDWKEKLDDLRKKEDAGKRPR